MPILLKLGMHCRPCRIDDEDDDDWSEDYDVASQQKVKVEENLREECALCGFWGELVI